MKNLTTKEGSIQILLNLKEVNWEIWNIDNFARMTLLDMNLWLLNFEKTQIQKKLIT